MQSVIMQQLTKMPFIKINFLFIFLKRSFPTNDQLCADELGLVEHYDWRPVPSHEFIV